MRKNEKLVLFLMNGSIAGCILRHLLRSGGAVFLDGERERERERDRGRERERERDANKTRILVYFRDQCLRVIHKYIGVTSDQLLLMSQPPTGNR